MKAEICMHDVVYNDMMKQPIVIGRNYTHTNFQ